MIQEESNTDIRRAAIGRIGACILLIATLVCSTSVSAQTVTGELSRIGDATHLEFKGESQWNYDLSRGNDGTLELIVPAFDEKTEMKLRTWTDNFVEQILIDKNGPDGRYRVKFKLADPSVESFDYLTDEPSRLIIDFYKQIPAQAENKIQTGSVAKSGKENAKKKKPSKKSFSDQKYTKFERDETSRKPAGELDPGVKSNYEAENSIEGEFPMRGAFDGGDPNFDRFSMKEYEVDENAVIASRQNIYIRFPMLKMPVSELESLMNNKPEYVIKKKASKENKEARLLLQLHKRGRHGLFLKTYNYFTQKYPNSDYDEIVRHLAAEIHFDKYRKSNEFTDYQKAESIYKYLLQKYPDSVLAKRTALILAYSSLEQESGLDTLQRFQAFLSKYPEAEEADRAQKAIAQGYMQLNKFDDALAVYEELSKKATFRNNGIEAFYRMGDVHFEKRDYEKAIEAYQEALQVYPDQEKMFPSAHYNMGESYFWLGKYRDALAHYVEFLKRFPSHKHGGYAMTRIGENLEILGADQSRVIGAFLESYFRYRNSPGANVARVRMLGQRMKGMKEKELKKALEEMDGIAAKSELPRVKEFVTLMIADGLHRRKEHEKAMELLISYYQKNPTSTNLEFFKKRILRDVAEVLKKKVENKKFLEGLKFHSEYSNTWLRNSDRLDVPYFMAQAYEQAGVLDEAEKIYNLTLASVEKIAGTEVEKEKRITEHLPTKEQLNLRLAKVAMNEREYTKAFDHLGKIANLEDLKDSEKIERVEIAAEIAEQRGMSETAKKYLTQLANTWKGDPQLLAPVLFRLAQLHNKSEEYVDGIQSIERIEELKSKKNGIADSLWAEVLQLKGQILEKQGKSVAAVETYLNLLEQFERERPLASVRYKAGRMLFDKGDLKGAENIWDGLDPEKDSMFVKLAKERLEHAKWQDSYQKYINRIPAMSGKE